MQIGKGDKASFLKIGEFSYSAVKFALQDCSNRVFEEIPSSNHGFIESISFQGGKFDGQTIHFSSSLNTLIGIRGSGKSAILESIRYILGIDPQADQSYKIDLIKNIWGSGGKATLLIYDKHGRKYYTSRILNERITVLDENGYDLNISPLSLLDGVQYFGQKDLSTSADQEKELLSKLVRTSIDNEAVTKHINELITAPYIFIFGLVIKTKLSPILITHPIKSASAGVYISPSPNKEPCIVWFIPTNTIVTAAIWRICAPSDAFG